MAFYVGGAKQSMEVDETGGVLVVRVKEEHEVLP